MAMNGGDIYYVLQLIDALDRRAPQAGRPGVDRDVAALRRQAVRRLGELRDRPGFGAAVEASGQ